MAADGAGDAAELFQHPRDGRIVADRRRPVAPAQATLGVENGHPGQAPRVAGDPPLPRPTPPRPPVVRIGAWIEKQARPDLTETQHPVEYSFGIDQTGKGRALFHEAASLEVGPGSHRGDTGTERVYGRIGLAHLREIVQAGNSAIVPDAHEEERPTAPRAQIKRFARRRPHLDRGERVADLDRRNAIRHTHAVYRCLTSSARSRFSPRPPGSA